MRSPALVLAGLLVAGAATAELVPYEATLRLDVVAARDTWPTRLVDVTFSGLADVEAGVVSIEAGDLSTPVPADSGFGGTLVNGALVFSIGGAGAGTTCTQSVIQERCIAGGGFGGVMPLLGLTQLGQPLDAWGAGAVGTGMTSMGLTREVEGTRWTTGIGEAWFYVPETDPTPFLLNGAGSFAGLPSTDPDPGVQGFRAVTPMVVTGSSVSSDPNARGLATLTVRFAPRPVPLLISTVLAAALAASGVARLRASPGSARA